MENYAPYFDNAVKAGQDMAGLSPEMVKLVLQQVAQAAIAQTPWLLQENQKDLNRMEPTDAKYDRLQLTAGRIQAIADDMRRVANMDSPLGEVLLDRVLPNGLQLSKVRVPLGVVGVIYEARPNVTFDVFALCFKTGNVCVLKGGSDADYSNQAIAAIIREVLTAHQINPDMVTLLPAAREATSALLNAVGQVDVLIPRGSQQLINYVRQQSRIPVIETGAGIVHTYFDAEGDLQKGIAIINNAKTRRVSVCNALDCLLVHDTRLADLPALLAPLAQQQVELYADEAAYTALQSSYPATHLHAARPEHFGTEFLSLKMAVKTVADLPQALQHIAEYSSKHSEAIITENTDHALAFMNRVDAAAVYVNASTAFTDGGQFGLGAEIGISTQKLHARGPMGLEELTSYKWLIQGAGHIRA